MPVSPLSNGAIASYRVRTRAPIAGSSYRYAFSLIHDAPIASWEQFNEGTLPKYVKDGVRTLHARLDRLADLSTPHTPEDDKNLWFMLESLIQARRLIEETKVEDSTK